MHGVQPLKAHPVPFRLRVGNDGKVWATASIACNVARHGQDEDTEWINLAAFGKAAEVLLKHQGGEPVNVYGSLTRQTYTGRDGDERTSWQLRVEHILSARTTRPSKKRNGGQDNRQQQRPQQQQRPPESDFPDDLLPF